MRFLKMVLGFSAVFAVAACGNNNPTYSFLPTGQTFQQTSPTINNQVDIVFVIDNQPNMSAFQASLVASFQTFMNLFETKGFDFKIAVETTDGYMADPTLNGYSAANSSLADFNDCSGSTCSGVFVLLPTDPNMNSDFAINAKPNKDTAGQDARSFSSLREAFQTPDAVNAGFLRPSSFLAVVIVDNQDDFSDNMRCSGCNVNLRYNDPNLDPISTYVNFLDQLTGTTGATARYNVSAMTQIATPCQGGTNMTRIMALANQTNGVLGDICQSDYGASMIAIANKIGELSTQFFLNRAPDVSTIVVQVNGVNVPEDATNGWTYDSTANSVVFHGSAIPAQGSTINVYFQPATV